MVHLDNLLVPKTMPRVFTGARSSGQLRMTARIRGRWNRGAHVKQTGSEAADTTVSSSSATAPLRLGIVGCGSIVQDFHLPTILGHGDLKVTVLCDKDLAAATRVRLRFGLSALVTTELTDVAANADIALVAVPSRFH